MLLLVGGFLLAKLIQNNTSEVLINITELPQEFMEEYYAGTKQLKENANEDNILIISTLKDLSNTYGATDVVAAPNHQYFLQYPTAAEKEQALARFKEDKSIVSVDENYVRHLDAVNYNSWGIPAMYLDSALEVANSTNLSDVVVAIVDSGVDVSLAERYYPGKITGTYNVFSESELTTEMTDENGHGTHVFGTIAEGTANNVKILPIKVSKNGSISSLDIKIFCITFLFWI